MKEKLVLFGWFIITAPILLTSCEKLREEPKGSLTKESFFTNTEDLHAGVTGIYYNLVSSSWSGYLSSSIWMPLMGSDDITTLAATKESFSEADRFIVSNLNGGVATIGWSKPYKIIFGVNNLLEGIGDKKFEGDQSYINDQIAAARFLRAWAYFWVVRLYGEVPLVTTTDIDRDAQKASVKDIYDFIVDDLKFAADNLLDSRTADDIAMPTSWAAKGLLSKVYLTMAGWPLKDVSKYALAAQTSKDIIDNAGIQLAPHFEDVFLIANKNKNYILWSIQSGDFTKSLIPPYLNSIPGSATNPLENKPVAGWDDMFAEIGFFNRFPSGHRKDVTFYTVNADGLHWDDPVSPWSSGHPHYAKYRDGTVPGTASFQSDFWASQSVILLRYAEVLLIYAEAQAMADGTPNESSYQAVNMIRRRAMGLDVHTPDASIDLIPGLSAEQFRDSVVAEKGWELAGEFNRWFDLTRTETVEKMNALKASGDLPPLQPITKEKYYMPIPFQETELNPNLK